MFAFDMVVIEVGSRALPPLVLEVEGWLVRLMPEFCLRLLQEGLLSGNSQPGSLFQRLWTANDRLAAGGTGTRSDGLGSGHDDPLLVPGPCSAADDDGSGRTYMRLARVISLDRSRPR